MQKTPNVNSSDLMHAREITHRLRGEHPPKETTGDKKDSQTVCLEYIKFSAAPFFNREPLPQEQALPDLDIDLNETSSFGPDTWEKFLGWCLKVTHAETAFLMDDVGLTISSQGKLPANKAEVCGNRLMIAFEQGSQMGMEGQKIRSLSFEFDSIWVTGIRVQSGTGTALMIGMTSETQLLKETRRTIENAIHKIIEFF
ncbi:MAG: hypothetical protein ACE5FZ_00695 [Nitrospiria bacterium]